MEVRVGDLLVLCLGLLVIQGDYAQDTTQAAPDAQAGPDEKANSVNVTFYQATPDEWAKEEDDTLKFKTKDQIAAAVNEICTEDKENCGQTNWVDIQKSHVGSYGAATVNNFYLNVSIYVKVPDGGSTVLLARETTHDAIVRARLPVHSETGRSIVGVDHDKFSPPPDHGMNQILIPIFFIVLIVIPIIILFATKKFRPKKRHQGSYDINAV